MRGANDARDALARAGVAHQLADPLRKLAGPADDVDLDVGAAPYLGPGEQVEAALALELAADEEDARRERGQPLRAVGPSPAAQVRARQRHVHAVAVAGGAPAGGRPLGHAHDAPHRLQHRALRSPPQRFHDAAACGVVPLWATAVHVDEGRVLADRRPHVGGGASRQEHRAPVVAAVHRRAVLAGDAERDPHARGQRLPALERRAPIVVVHGEPLGARHQLGRRRVAEVVELRRVAVADREDPGEGTHGSVVHRARPACNPWAKPVSRPRSCPAPCGRPPRSSGASILAVIRRSSQPSISGATMSPVRVCTP